jgi:hypothetical protein
MNENTETKTRQAPGRWSLGDLVDFEFLFSQQEKAVGPGAAPAQLPDEHLYANFQAQLQTEGQHQPDRAGLFRFWLETSRAAYFGREPSPGEQVESSLWWTSISLALGGFLLARGAVYSFFRAPESLAQRAEPINVFWYGIVCIGIPLVLTSLGFWWLLGVRPAPKLPRPPAFVRGALLGLLHPVLTRAARKASDLSGPEQRLAAQALWGAFRRRAMDRSSAIGLRLSIMTQSFGVGFTAGILLFSWLDCLFYSRVFGWQSTQFTITAEAAYKLVRLTAAPWAWLAGEGHGFPSLQQMAATRFVRYQDPGVFPAAAAAAWANYLVAAALVYGFLPRVLLYGLTRREYAQALKNPDFNQARFDRLWERLVKPQIRMLGPSGEAAATLPQVERTKGESPAGAVRCLVVVPEELNTPERRDALLHWLASEKSWTSMAIIPLAAEAGSIEEVLTEMARARGQAAITRAVLVQESFMPPVKGVLKLLLQIRAAMKDGGVAVGLVGKPSEHPLGEPPSKTDFAVWEAKVLSLADSGLDVFSFRTPVS